MAIPSSYNISWVRTNRRNPCQICNEYGWCELSSDGKVAHCMKVASDREALHRQGGWYHTLISEPLSFARPKKLTVVAPPVAQTRKKYDLSPEEISEIYAYFLSLLVLEAMHRAKLQRDGIPEDVIALCRSLRYKDSAMLARKLVEKFGDKVYSHPLVREVERSNGRNFPVIAACGPSCDGILFPAISFHNNNSNTASIRGVQLRSDDSSRSQRYIWLSHDGLGGTPLFSFAARDGAANYDWIMIGEGFKKGGVSSSKWDCWAIQAGGVASWKPQDLASELDYAISRIKAAGLTSVRIAIAFDHPLGEKSDRARLNVARAKQKLVNWLAACYPEAELLFLGWDAEKFGRDEHGRIVAKGVDDAWAAGATHDDFVFETARAKPYLEWLKVEGEEAGPRLVREERPLENRFVSLPLQAYKTRYPQDAKPKRMYTRQEAQNAHLELLGDLLTKPDTKGQKVNINSSTGGGKSFAADKVLAELSMKAAGAGERVVMLTPDKTNLRERTHSRAETGLGWAVGQKLTHVQQGREKMIDEGSPEFQETVLLKPGKFDCYNSEVIAATNARHSPAQSVCVTCPLRTLERYKEAHPGKSDAEYASQWICEKDGYWKSRSDEKAAHAIVATAGTYLNSSDILDEVDRVVIDEGVIEQQLISAFTVGHEDLALWRRSFARLEERMEMPPWSTGGQGQKMSDKQRAAALRDLSAREDFLLLWSILADVLNELPDQPVNRARGANQHAFEAKELLRAALAKRAPYDNLDSLLLRLPVVATAANQAYSFERPYYDSDNSKGKKRIFPKLATADLLRAIQQGDAVFKAEIRVREEEGEGGGSKVSCFYTVRQVNAELHSKLVDPERTVVILDRTLPPVVSKLLPGFKKVAFEIEQPLHVTQITNRLFAARDLETAETREKLSEALAAYCKTVGAKRPLVVLPKRFAPTIKNDNGETVENPKGIQLPMGTVALTWGLHRGSNDYQDCDAVMLVGHYQENLEEIKANLDCARAFYGEGAVSAETTWLLKLYNHVSDGQAFGRWQEVYEDQELQEAVDYHLAANYLQAIGRTRPGNREASNPVPVLIMSNDPVAQIRVDRLLTTDKLLEIGETVSKPGLHNLGFEASAAVLTVQQPLPEKVLEFPQQTEIVKIAVGQNTEVQPEMVKKEPATFFLQNHVYKEKTQKKQGEVLFQPQIEFPEPEITVEDDCIITTTVNPACDIDDSSDIPSPVVTHTTHVKEQEKPVQITKGVDYYSQSYSQLIEKRFLARDREGLDSLYRWSIPDDMQHWPDARDELLAFVQRRLDELRRL